MAQDKILVIGSAGQIGTELTAELRNKFGKHNVIASDVKEPLVISEGPFELLDVLRREELAGVVRKHSVNQIYLLAALLSASAEEHAKVAWELNMQGLFNVLDLAKEKRIKKIFWPSSIAVFGPNTPKIKAPQYTIMDPSSVYGISKLAGERWCEYYNMKHGVDVRSLRYPGLIGYHSAPAGGTTDYAVHIFMDALRKNSYDCFLSEDTVLPMMYMPDAIEATIALMEAPGESLSIRSSYNVAAMSFSPKELSDEITKYFPGFECRYSPDHRQAIAESWPQSIDDEYARRDWNWKPLYNLRKMTRDMVKNIALLLEQKIN